MYPNEFRATARTEVGFVIAKYCTVSKLVASYAKQKMILVGQLQMNC